jgi:hypothetical protein
MANRIVVKKIVDDYGRETSSYQLINDCLISGQKRFGEIKRFLADKGIKYYDDKGLALALKSLIKRGEIRKNTIKPFPTYYLRNNVLNQISATSQEFRREIIHKISQFPYPEQEVSESNEHYLLRQLIHLFGIYNLYVQIKSWQFTSNNKSHEANYDARSEWFRNTFPLGNESFLLENGIRDLTYPRFYTTAEKFNESVSKIYQNKKKLAKLNELEKNLKKMFPDQIMFFDQILNESPKKAKNMQKWIKDSQQHEAWKKRLITKNKKTPKKKLKPNECPRCHYDGSTKVKVGHCKGMIFENGFAIQPGSEHYGKHCPACGLRENIPNG